MSNARFSKFITNAIVVPLTLGILVPTCALGSVELSVYGGGVGTQTSKSKLVVSSTETDDLVGNNDKTEFTPGLGIAYNYQTHRLGDELDSYPVDSISLGFDLYNFRTPRDGVVLLFGSPNFANNLYDMDIHSTRLMLDAQVNSQPFWLGIQAFIEAGAGIARNTLNYDETPLPGITNKGLRLSNHTDYEFAYDLGGGLKIPLSNCIQLSARYLYSNLGDVKSSRHSTPEIAEPIRVKLYAQSVLLGLTYIIN